MAINSKKRRIMKKYSFYCLLLLASASLAFTSCKDDKVDTDNYDHQSDRLFMPQFRVTQNTSNSQDQYGCGIASEFPYSGSTHVNDIWLNWYGVEGAVAYHLKGKVQGGRWNKDEVLDTMLYVDEQHPERSLSFLHQDLAYSTGYLYCIQAISPKGDAYNSKWSGWLSEAADGSDDLGHQPDMSRDDDRGALWTGSLNTGMRYDIPAIFWVENVTKNTMRVRFNTTVEGTYKDFLEASDSLTISSDGSKWVFDRITIQPSSDNPDLPSLSHDLSSTDLENGYVDFTGLESNAAYIVNGSNSKVKRYYDSQFNSTMVRMQGDAAEPIKIEWAPDPNDTILSNTVKNAKELLGKATRIDTVFINYMKDNSISEGQVFYLEGGKTYYIQSSFNMTKGFTLETDPADLAAGKGRAEILLGVGSSDDAGYSTNATTIMLCRNAASGAENGVSLAIQPIHFNELNIHPHMVWNYMDKNGTGGDSKRNINGNYFINMNSQGLSFSLSELSITNCQFSGLTRGFIRFQGPNRQLIEHMKVEGCVFTDCGPYDNNGRGYSWFAGPGNRKDSNFFQWLEVKNNSFIDVPKHAFVSENGNLAWPANTRWNIEIENNTFVNLSPRSSSSGHGLLLETRYAPAGSKITVKKNLFVMVRKGDSDDRNLYMRGMRIDTKDIIYDFADNYATTVPAWGNYKASTDETTTLSDGLFTNYQFSHSSSGAGYQKGALNVGGYGETQIKFGDNRNGNEDDAVGYQLTPEELFKDPQPLEANGGMNMHRHNVDGFYYNNTDRVKNHPIVTKKIGDQRWATGAAWK